MGDASSSTTDDDLLLKNFFAEVSEVERDNEVHRFSLSLFLYDSLYLYAQLFFLIASAISAKLADFVRVKLSIFIVLCIQRDFQFYTIGFGSTPNLNDFLFNCYALF